MKIYPKLYASCIPVKGYKQSFIYDLQRSKSSNAIPNDLYNILTLHENKTIEEIKREFDNQYDEVIDEYFDFLNRNGEVNITNHALFNRYLYGEDPLSDPICQKCKYFPICVGNCPHWRLRNYYEDTNIDVCTSYKTGLLDYLEERIESFLIQKNNQHEI